MSNKRFKKTECAIFYVYCKLKDYPSAKKIAKLAHISRSTLYRHHRKVQSIPKDYEEYLLAVYKRRMRIFLKKPDIPLKILILRTLIYISSNKEIFKVLLSESRSEVIKKMLDILEPKIAKKWLPYKNKDKIYKVYENEVIGIIEAWAKQNFSDKKLRSVLNDIIYLTDSAWRRLSVLSE